jgi:hypothetical protein
MSRELAADWIRQNAPNIQRAAREAIEVFQRHGWAVSDLDYLQYEAQGEGRGEGDPAFEYALELLGRMREAGIPIPGSS